ncbi:MAG: hypothetical protein AB1635_17805 [Acidobacteriota bacterium]
MSDGARIRALAIVVSLAALAAGCAARGPARPGGTPTPDAGAEAAFAAATAACAGLRTFTGELALSGRAGNQRVRGRLIVGLAAPASARLEGVAPFGAPLFILAAADDRGTLLLPRDRRVLADAPVRDLLDGLTGIGLGAGDLRLVLTGCLAAGSSASAGRRWPGGWQSVDVGAGRTAYLRRLNGAPAVVAADYEGWRVDYAAHRNGFPREVRLRAADAARRIDVTARVTQLEVNVPIDAAAFAVTVPPGVEPITLADLRQMQTWH